MSATTIEQRFLRAVERTIRRHHMLEQGDTVLVGVSGGPDSVALLNSLVKIGPKWSLTLVVVHLNHCLRGETSDREAEFVGKIATALGIRYEIAVRDIGVYRAEHKLSMQEAARKVRYAFFGEMAAKYSANKLALGHHADDNAESILMHLVRGTGPLGLCGIPAVRDGWIIRPLMELTRREISEFLELGRFDHVTDRSNLDRKYLRNRVRHELLPLLRGHYNPDIVGALNRLGFILRSEEDFWAREVRKTFEALAPASGPDRMSLPAPRLAALHPALLNRLVRRAVLLLKGELKRFGSVHVEAVARLINAPLSSGRLDLPDGVSVVRERDEIRFMLGRPEEGIPFEYEIPGIQTTNIPEIGMSLKLSVASPGEAVHIKTCSATMAFFDLAAIDFPLVVRNFRPGDRFRPLGMKGSQKVKTFFINRKVPRTERLRSPILVSGARIIWIGGHRTDDSAKVTRHTRDVLKAELLRQ